MANTSLLGSFGDVSGSGLMFRNKLINGGFDIWQRGTSQTTSGYGSDDRWLNGHAGSTKTSSRQTFTLGQTDVPGNPTYFARTVVTLAGSPATSDYVLKRQNIEYVKTLAGQTATLSFWAKADAPKNMAVEFCQVFGTGGSPSAQINSISVTTFALTSSWKYFTATVNLPSISGKTLGTNGDDYVQMNFWLSAGADFNSRNNSVGQQAGTFDMANVQLEAGPQATPFEQRPVSTELSLCERYFALQSAAMLNGSYASGTDRFYSGLLIFRTIPRATPVYAVFSGTARWSMLGINIVSASSNTGLTFYSVVGNYGLYLTHARQAGGNTPVSGGSIYHQESDLIISISAEL